MSQETNVKELKPSIPGLIFAGASAIASAPVVLIGTIYGAVAHRDSFKDATTRGEKITLNMIDASYQYGEGFEKEIGKIDWEVVGVRSMADQARNYAVKLLHSQKIRHWMRRYRQVISMKSSKKQSDGLPAVVSRE